MADKAPQLNDRMDRPLVLCTLAGGVAVLAFLVRLLYLRQIESIPFFYDLFGDGQRYWEWAGEIAAGDWIGRETFYQAPAYPYYLAIVRRIAGNHLWGAHVAQAVLGSLACGLLVLAGRAFVSARAGLCAGLLVALYGPAIFFDGLIQKATLSLFLMTALLCVLGWASRTAGLWTRAVWGLLAGFVLALLALTREQSLLLGPLVLVWMVVDGWRDSSGATLRRTMPPLLFVVGLGVVLGAVAWRNHRVGGDAVITTVQAGPNFYVGNHAGATGRYVALRPGAERPPLEQQAATELAEAALGREVTPGEVSEYWLGRSWEYVRHQPLDWLGLLAHKWVLVWNSYELSDTESYTLYAHLSWLLAVCGTVNHFGVLWPLAAVGWAATIQRWRRLWLLYAMVLVVAGGVALFYVFARYRYPLVPLLAIFAGAGVMEVIRTIKWYAAKRGAAARASSPTGRPLHPALSLGLVTVVAVASNLRLGHERMLDATAYENWGVVMGDSGRYSAAAYLFSEALRYRPDAPELHTHLGATLAVMGEHTEALKHLATAIDLDPTRATAHYHAGVVLADMGQTDMALQRLREAVRIDPDFSRANFRIGLICAAQQRYNDALRAYREVVRADPGVAAAYYNIGVLLDHQGLTDEALAAYRRTLELDPQHSKARAAIERAERNHRSSETG